MYFKTLIALTNEYQSIGGSVVEFSPASIIKLAVPGRPGWEARVRFPADAV